MSNNWISVKDKLPEYTCRAGSTPFTSVLVCVNNDLVSEALYIDGQWEVLGIITDKVTHWMPLPDPPTQ